MQGPLAALTWERQVLRGLCLLVVSLGLFFLLFPLGGAPYGSGGPRGPYGKLWPGFHAVAPGFQQRYCSSSRDTGYRQRNFGAPYGPEGPLGQSRVVRRGWSLGPSASVVGGPPPCDLSERRDGTGIGESRGGPSASFGEEEEFVHHLLIIIFSLHLRMQALLRHQQHQAEVRDAAETSPPLLRLYEKRDRSCVGAADIVTQILILWALKNRFPGDICIAEETADLFASLLPHRDTSDGNPTERRASGAPQPPSIGETAAAAAVRQLLRELRLPETALQKTGASSSPPPASEHTVGSPSVPVAEGGPPGAPVATVPLDNKGSSLSLLREVVWLLSDGAPQDLEALMQEALLKEGPPTAAGTSGGDSQTPGAPTTTDGRGEGGPYMALFLRGLQRLLRRPGAPAAGGAAAASSPAAAAAAAATAVAAARGDTLAERRLRCWIIDPIDGTTAFFGGERGHCFSTAIALLVGPQEQQQQQQQQEEKQQQQQQQREETARVVLASICCPSYDLWGSGSSNNSLLHFCSAAVPRESPYSSPAFPGDPCKRAAAAAAAAAGAKPPSPLGALKERAGMQEAGQGAPMEGEGGAPYGQGPLIWSERLRGCVLTKAEGLPARISVRDTCNGALLHLIQQQQQQQVSLSQPVGSSPPTDWPSSKRPHHLRKESPTASTPAAAETGVSSVPFRWTVSTPNYQQILPLLQQQFASPVDRRGPLSLQGPHPKGSQTGGPHEEAPQPPADSLRMGPLLPSAANRDFQGVNAAIKEGGAPQRVPQGAPPSGQEFIALRCGHIVKYLAVAIGQADAFLLFPTPHLEGPPRGPPMGAPKTERTCLPAEEQPQQQTSTSRGHLDAPNTFGGAPREEGPPEGSPKPPLLMVWDHAAGAAMVEMLGGVVVDSGNHRVQSYCYVPPPSLSEVSQLPSAVPSKQHASSPTHARGAPESAGGPKESFLTNRGAAPPRKEAPSPPPVSFALKGEALIAARSPEAAARALAAVEALRGPPCPLGSNGGPYEQHGLAL